jgi:hypothetical protein
MCSAFEPVLGCDLWTRNSHPYSLFPRLLVPVLFHVLCCDITCVQYSHVQILVSHYFSDWLFHDAFLPKLYTFEWYDDRRVTNSKIFGRNQSWPEFSLEGMRKKHGDFLTKLNNFMSWALEKPPIMHHLKNSPAFYGTRRFITVFTRTLHWFLSWARSIQSIPP